MASINVYADAGKVYEITDLAKKIGQFRKAHLPYGVHTSGKNLISLEFYTARSAIRFRESVRPRRKGLKIQKMSSELKIAKNIK